METHQFKRHVGTAKCKFCDELWPSMNEVVSKLQICEKCGLCVHTSCKALSNRCLPCGVGAPSPSLNSALSKKGKLTLRICQAYDLGPTSGALLYGMWRISNHLPSRTENAIAGNNECVWPDKDQQVIELDLTKASDLDLKLEIWNSYYEIFDKILFTSTINLSPVMCHPQYELERWFPLQNMSDSRLNGVAKVLVQIIFEPEIVRIPPHSPESDKVVVYDEKDIILEEPKGRTYSNLSETIEAALLEMEEKADSTIAECKSPIAVNVENEDDNICSDILQISADSNDQKSKEDEDDEVFQELNVSADSLIVDQSSSLENKDESEKDVDIHSISDGSNSLEPDSANAEKTVHQLHVEDSIESDSTNSLKDNITMKPPIPPTSDTSSSSSAPLWYEKAYTRWNNFLSSFDTSLSKHIETSKSIDGISNFESLDKNAVGLLHLSIKGASYLKTNHAVECDHFILISIDGRQESFKTDIVRKSINPIFDAQFSLAIPYFRSNITLTLMDAKTKRKIGSAKFFPYEVIVRDADYRMNKNSTKPFTTLLFKDEHLKEDIGYFSLDLSFEENLHDHFWSPNVTWTPTGPEEELSVERLGIHIARFTAIMDFFQGLYQEYLHIMEWRDPVFTSVLFILFLYCIFYIQADYRFSGIFFGMIFLMTRTLYRRKTGVYKQMYISRGKRDISLEYRPMAKLRIAAVAFKSGRSSMGVISSSSDVRTPMIKVTYHPMLENSGENATEPDKRQHLVGYLGGSEDQAGEQLDGVSQIMSTFVKSETNRKDWLLQNVMDPWPLEPSSPVLQEKDVTLARFKEISLVYPILQPLTNKIILSRPTRSESVSIKEDGISFENDFSDHSSMHSNIAADHANEVDHSSSSNNFLPWTQNQSEIKITLLPQSSSFLEGDEEYVTMTMLDIVNFATVVDKDSNKFEVMKWFSTKKLQMGSPKERHIILSDLDNYVYDGHDTSGSDLLSASIDTAQNRLQSRKNSEVLLRISLEIPDMRKTFTPTEEERKASFILQEVLSNRPEKESSTLAVLWNMRDHVKYVQNVMSRILNSIESFKNIFNWTNPAKTWPIYICLVVIWLLTVLIPGRILILILGLYQFLYIILPIPDGNEIVIRFMNFWNSIPNDDDIEQIYALERKSYHEEKQKEKKVHMHNTLLNLSLPTKWSSSVKMKASKGNMPSQSSSLLNDWKNVFMVIQGKRIIWWISEMDFEQSKPPSGQLILTGLSGITQVSPVDQRLFEQPQLLSAVFGQDVVGRPMKLSVSLESERVKEEFEKIIMRTVSS